jgi:hypothetical protein
VRLPRFRCAACDTIEVRIDWPPHCRSTPELERLQAHLAALMTYRTAADVLEQMLPVGTGRDKETMRRHTLRAGSSLRDSAAIRPEMTASAITVTLDGTFIRSCEDGERDLEVGVRQGRAVRASEHAKEGWRNLPIPIRVAPSLFLQLAHVFFNSLGTPGARRHAPVNAFQQHRQLRRRQRYRAFFCLRQDEAAFFKLLGEEAKALAGPG